MACRDRFFSIHSRNRAIKSLTVRPFEWRTTPFSPGQIDRLLRETIFHVERRDIALFVPPVDWRVLLRSAPFWETAGRRLLPGFAGVTITEASKDIYAVMPIEGRLRRTILAEAA